MPVTQRDTLVFRRTNATLAPMLTEKTKRVWAGLKAARLGYGRITSASQMTGLALNTMRADIRDVHDPAVTA